MHAKLRDLHVKFPKDGIVAGHDKELWARKNML
ncbi:hypothetical protein F383_18076 [Gossypium arboreum]|uniref:Uncharacterized protein n=1 Tax=Gossypium arboreum TaxID=29729 RepID=A0A0B0NME6_GOSAR|nr:hypothetical protein F383_18076 [Gossypium arboreum]